jgi:transcriptional regulator with XRE-family HTH domain
MSPVEQFAANLRRERLRRELSQEGLAALCGLHMTEVSRLERARREPRLGTIVTLAKGLGIRPAVLVKGTDA